MPKVSLIMPVYNAERNIEKSLSCMLEQTFSDMEYIIVNDCSTDSTLRIIKKIIGEYPNRESQIQVISHKENKGVALARQTGLDAARGKYTIHFDSDDCCELNMIELLYNKAMETNADIVICDYNVIYSKKHKRITQDIPDTGERCMKNLLLGVIHGALWNKLIRRSLYVENKLSFIPHLNMWEDKTMLIRVCFFSKIVEYLPQSLYCYNLTNTNSISSKLSVQSLSNIVQSVSVIEGFLKQQDVLSQYADMLNSYKLGVKSELIANSIGKRQIVYSRYYSETNNLIWKQVSLGFHYKIALWFAVHRLFFLSNIVFYLLKLIKRKTRG